VIGFLSLWAAAAAVDDVLSCCGSGGAIWCTPDALEDRLMATAVRVIVDKDSNSIQVGETFLSFFVNLRPHETTTVDVLS